MRIALGIIMFIGTIITTNAVCIWLKSPVGLLIPVFVITIFLIANFLIKRDEPSDDSYKTRLKRSASGFCGATHQGEGPFLSVSEIQSLLRNEVKRMDDE